MPKQKMTKEEFLSKAMPLLMDKKHPPTYKGLADATGYSVGGVQYKLLVCGIERENGWVAKR